MDRSQTMAPEGEKRYTMPVVLLKRYPHTTIKLNKKEEETGGCLAAGAELKFDDFKCDAGLRTI